jgi:pyrroline-5-carboxylate reductase
VVDGAPLVVVGGGNMGAAFLSGLLGSGRAPGTIAVSETAPSRRATLVRMFPAVSVHDDVPRCSEAIIAVKPADVPAACRAAVAAGAARVVSIAAGVRLAALHEACGEGVRVVRAMPNTPALVGLAATAMSAGHGCTDADRAWARELLSCVGSVIEVEEAKLDAFTGLVGSGPAYAFYVAEALRDAAVAEGFDAETSAALVARVMLGAAVLLDREPLDAKALRARVMSPNGTTAAGIAALDERRVRDAFVAAVRAATARSKELGDA